MNDGSIVIDTKIDNEKAEKELDKLNKKIQSLEDKIYTTKGQRVPLLEESSQIAANLDAAKQKLAEMKSGESFYTTDSVKEQESSVKSLQKEWDGVQKKVEAYDAQIRKSELELDLNRERAGGLEEQLSHAGNGANVMDKALEKADGVMNSFVKRVKGLARRVFVFTIISAALRGVRGWLSNVIKTNDEASAAMARLKGALLTMAQPLVSVIIPAFTALVNVLTAVISRIAQLMSALFGTTAEESAKAAEALNNETAAIKGAGGAAKKAGKQLANFDEINQLTSQNNGGAAQPNFQFDNELSDRLKKIADYVALIGAGLLLWKVSESLPSALGMIANKLGGILIAVGGVMIAWDGLKDAWENGVDFKNMAEIIAGVAAAAAGLYIAFGKNAAGIALVVGGIAMLITAFRDAMQNGLNLQNTLLAIAGLLSAGLGIGIITGSWIPMLIAAIAGILLALVELTGNGGRLIDNLKAVFKGFSDMITGFLTGDLELALDGAKTIVKGFVNIVLTIVGSLVNAIIKGLNWLIDKINSISIDIPEWVPMFGGSSWSPHLPKASEWAIPQLAQGAVIPPNREFLAVLGDQKSGTNIEAPMETILQAFRRALSENGGGAQKTIVLELDRRELGRAVLDVYNQESSRIGLKLGGDF